MMKSNSKLSHTILQKTELFNAFRKIQKLQRTKRHILCIIMPLWFDLFIILRDQTKHMSVLHESISCFIYFDLYFIILPTSNIIITRDVLSHILNKYKTSTANRFIAKRIKTISYHSDLSIWYLQSLWRFSDWIHVSHNQLSDTAVNRRLYITAIPIRIEHN